MPRNPYYAGALKENGLRSTTPARRTSMTGPSGSGTSGSGTGGSGPTDTGPELDPFDPAADAAGLHTGRRAMRWTAVIGVIAAVGLAAYFLVPSTKPTTPDKGKAVAQAPAAKPDAKAAEPDKGKAEAAKPDAKKPGDSAVAQAPAVPAPDKPADKAAPAAGTVPERVTLYCVTMKTAASPTAVPACRNETAGIPPTLEWAQPAPAAPIVKGRLLVTLAGTNYRSVGDVEYSETEDGKPLGNGGQVEFALATATN